MRSRREAQPVVLDHASTPPSARFVWQDLAPGAIQLDAPLVYLEIQSHDGRWVPLVVDSIPVDDRGLHIEIRYLQEVPDAGAGLWQATWYPRASIPGAFRFGIIPRQNLPALYSEAFTLSP